MNEIATIQPAASIDLATQMRFAESVAGAGMLPQAYRGKPADVLLAVGLGSAMGLSPAESLYRIDVIQGTPTASAELIASNVRKAGHKLRVEVDEANVRVTATVIRADDPDFPHVVTRDMAWAKKMGLDKKDNYQKQPLTMLQWRAISGVARLACPEALYGVAYTADEIRDGIPGTPTAQPVQTFTVAHVEAEPMTDKTRRRMFALFGQKGVTEDKQLAGINYYTGQAYESRGDLTEPDAQTVIARLEELDDATPETTADSATGEVSDAAPQGEVAPWDEEPA